MTEINECQAVFDKAIAGKLRSLAAAARADGDDTPEVRQALGLVADQMEARAANLDPPVEEPIEFASVVRDRSGELYVRLGAAQALPWGSGEALRAWSDLYHPEVLRVGIGDDEWHRLDVANAQTDAYTKGAEDFAAKARRELSALRATVITAPEKRTADNALALIAALLGES